MTNPITKGKNKELTFHKKKRQNNQIKNDNDILNGQSMMKNISKPETSYNVNIDYKWERRW